MHNSSEASGLLSLCHASNQKIFPFSYCSLRKKFLAEDSLLQLLQTGNKPVADVLRWGVKCGTGPFSAKYHPFHGESQAFPPFSEESYNTYFAFGPWLCAHVLHENMVWETNIPIGNFSLAQLPSTFADPLAKSHVQTANSAFTSVPQLFVKGDELNGEAYIEVTIPISSFS